MIFKANYIEHTRCIQELCELPKIMFTFINCSRTCIQTHTCNIMQQNTAMNLCTDMLQPAIVKQSGEDANHTTRTISYNVTNATYEIDHPKLEQDKKPLLYRLVQDSGRLTILQKVKIALLFSTHWTWGLVQRSFWISEQRNETCLVWQPKRNKLNPWRGTRPPGNPDKCCFVQGWQ